MKRIKIRRVKRRYFPKKKPPKYSLEGFSTDDALARTDPPPRPILPRVILTVFAVGLIGYVLMTHGGVRIDVEVDLSNWEGETKQSEPAAKDAQMKVVASALMHELVRQGIFPKSVDVDNSTISITAPKAPITGVRLGDMVDNIMDCHVGAFEWEGTSVDVDMLRNTTSCNTLFDACDTAVDASGQSQLNVALTPDGRKYFADFQDTMVFVKAAYPIAMIYDYRVDDDGNLVIKSSDKSAQSQHGELHGICNAMRNRERLEGVAFKDISTRRIGLNLPTF